MRGGRVTRQSTKRLPMYAAFIIKRVPDDQPLSALHYEDPTSAKMDGQFRIIFSDLLMDLDPAGSSAIELHSSFRIAHRESE